MERRKAEIQTNFNRLKVECESLVNLLQSLLSRHQTSMKIIENMRPEEILKNSNFFLNVSRSQYEAIEKVLTINLDLESFLMSEPSPRISSSNNGSTFTLPLTTDDSDVSVELTSLDKVWNPNKSSNIPIDNSSPVHKTSVGLNNSVENKSGTNLNLPCNNQIAELSSTHVDRNDDKLSPVVDKSSINQAESEQGNKNNIEDSCFVVDKFNINIESQNIGDKTITPNSSCIVPDKSNSNTIGKSPGFERCITPKNDYPSKFGIDNLQEKTTDTKTKERTRSLTPADLIHSRRCVESNDDTDDDRVSSESSETVMDKLNKRKFTSRQQRYLKNIKKPPMPDLSFTVVPYNSSTEFCSATDGELDVQTESDVHYQESYNHSVIENAEPLELYDKCVVSHVISPSEFYVNKLHVSHDQFEYMVTQLERLGSYFKQFATKEEANLNINRYCMAYSMIWESWNRAEVLDWHLNATPNTAGVEVQFVDYGDYEIVPYHNLRTLPHELCDKPRLAVKCHLAYLFPPGSSSIEFLKKWPESSIETAKELLCVPNTLYSVLFIEKSGDTYGIDLVRGEQSEDGKTIGQQLIDANKAVEIFQKVPTIKNSFMKEQLKTAQGMSGITSDMNLDEIMQRLCENVVINESDRLEEAITGYAAQDEARICRFTKNGSCFKGANCKQDHEGLSKDGITTDKQFIYTSALTMLPNPQIGQDLKIIITSVCSVNKFYGQIRSYDSKGESLKALSNSLNLSNAMHQPLKILPANGEIVIAKYCDNKWYRAKVCDITSSNEVADVLVKVFFVDYGDVMDVQFKDLRQISEKYLHLPFQAVRFHINNIIPKKGSDPSKAIEYFEQVYLYKIFTVNVLYVASGFIEVLVSNRDNQDIGTHLIDVGYAESKIISLLPLENGKFLVD